MKDRKFQCAMRHFIRCGSLIVLAGNMVITGSIVIERIGFEKQAEKGDVPVRIENTEVVKEDELIEYFMEEHGEPTEASIGDTSEPASILTAEEEQNLQDEAIAAAEQCMELYKEVEITYPETEYSRIEGSSDQQRKDVVKQLGKQGLVSVSDDINMENYQKMEEFYSAYLSGKDAMVTVFSVHRDGNIDALTFVHRKGIVQSYYVAVGWREGGIPEIKSFGINNLEEIKYYGNQHLWKSAGVLQGKAFVGRMQGTDKKVHIWT